MPRCPNCRRPVDEGDRACDFCDELLGGEQNTQETSQQQRGQQGSREEQTQRTGRRQSQGQQDARNERGQARGDNYSGQHGHRNTANSSGHAQGSRRNQRGQSGGTQSQTGTGQAGRHQPETHHSGQRTRQDTANSSRNLRDSRREQRRQASGVPPQDSGQSQGRTLNAPGQNRFYYLSKRVPYVSGSIAGAGAFLSGFLLTLIIKLGEASSELSGAPFYDEPEIYQGIGWIFYAMHYVQISISASGPGGSISESIGAANVNDTYLFIVPIGLLVLAGYLIAKRTDAKNVKKGAIAGVSITIGYFLFAVLASFIVAWNGNVSGADVTVRPNLIQTVLIAGIAYPVILGGIGGAIAGSTNVTQ